MQVAKETQSEESVFFVYFLAVTAMVCGALIMVVEVLGSRVIGPFFGVSLFVWTSLITVTLVALAAGYAAGGIVSDRKHSPDYLYGIILAAGFLVLMIPVMKGFVLKLCVPLGLRSGTLVSSLLLFGPSLFFLGCVSPYIVRIAAKEMRNIGRTVGVFYALSTTGSFLGTIITGFFLIAYLGIDRIFVLIGLLLICLSLVYFLLFRHRWRPLLLLALVPLFIVLHPATPYSKIMPNGTKITRVFSTDTFYGNIKVLDYSYGNVHTRELIIDGLVQGGIDMRNRLSVYEYAYFMEFLPYSLHPAGKSCLVIGLGAGLIPMWYEQRGIRTDVVDIDPAVADVAREYFDFRVSGDVIIADARYYITVTDKQYDYIILDVFNGDTTPGHILSVEAMRLLKARMTPTGILAMNLAGSLKRETFMTASVLKTAEAVFETVEVYPTFAPESGKGWGNLAVVAYDHAPATFDPEVLKGFPVHPLAISVREHLGRRFRFPSATPAVVLSDDYNPIDVYDSWLKENLRTNILETTDWDMLL